MSKALATKEANELAAAQDFVSIAGFEDLTPDDFSLPRLILVQSQHAHEDAENNIGSWYRTDTNEHVKNPHILVIGIAKSRAMFDENFSRDAKPLCRSDNGLTPRDEYIGTDIGGGFFAPDNCAACLYSNWDGNNPPRCQLADNWAGLTEDAAPIVFRLKGSGYKVSRQLKTTARVTQAKREPLFIELGSQKVTGDSGVYYAPTFKIVREEIPAEVVEMALAMNGVNLASRAAEVENFDDTEASVDVYTADEIQQAIETGVPLGSYTDKDAESAVAEELPF